MKTLFYIIIAYLAFSFVNSCQAFEVNQCVYNTQYQQHKKITKVRQFVYEYCIFKGLECKGDYLHSKRWFNKNHVITECPSNSLVDDLDLTIENSSIIMQYNVTLTDFIKREFECKCGCGKNKTKRQLIDKLQKLRDFIHRPIFVLSGYRCEKHNAKVGGVLNSQHLVGKAADIYVKGMSSQALAKLIERSNLFRNGGIGVYVKRNFVHVDIRGKHVRWKM